MSALGAPSSTPHPSRRLVATRTWTRWAPAVVAPALIAAVALVGAAQAGAAPDLPARSAEQVLAMVGESSVQALSGTLEQTSELGFPQLPTGRGSARGGSADGGSAGVTAASALELLTGSHTARVYLDGPTAMRVQVLDSLAERDLVRRGSDVWVYSSEQNAATHVTLPAGAGKSAPEAVPLAGDVPTPAQLAHQMIAAIKPSTVVTVGTGTTVAGRTAYDLVLRPRASDTLIASVSIAVDSRTGLPLSVEVRANGQSKPAFAVAFTSLTLGAPSAARFEFTPPAGATVTEQALPAMGGTAPAEADHPKLQRAAGDATHARPAVSGSGWDAVVELPAGTVPAELAASPLLAQAMTAVDGGRLLHTALVNVLLTADGRAFAGSVSVERLQAAAAAA